MDVEGNYLFIVDMMMMMMEIISFLAACIYLECQAPVRPPLYPR